MLSPLPQSFVAIVEHGSITRAADALGLARSAVSQNLKRLEEQLGVRLAVRSTRHLTLTPAGERFFDHCQKILSQAQLARTDMESFGARPSGVLTLTAPHALMAPVVAPALAQLRVAYPDVTPHVLADDARRDPVAEGIDLAISVGEQPDSSLRARRIGGLRDVYCVSQALAQCCGLHDKLVREKLDFAKLGTLAYVAHRREVSGLPVAQKQQVTLDLSCPQGPPLALEVGVVCSSLDAVAALVRQGMGVGLLPDLSVATELRSGALVDLNTAAGQGRKMTPIYALHAYDRMAPPIVQELIKTVAQQIAQLSAQAGSDTSGPDKSGK